jgi:type I restriction enzyme S subunit
MDETRISVLGAHASAVSEVNHLDQSILAKAFRGELVPQDPNDDPAETLLARIQAETRPPNTQKGGRVRRS